MKFSIKDRKFSDPSPSDCLIKNVDATDSTSGSEIAFHVPQESLTTVQTLLHEAGVESSVKSRRISIKQKHTEPTIVKALGILKEHGYIAPEFSDMIIQNFPCRFLETQDLSGRSALRGIKLSPKYEPITVPHKMLEDIDALLASMLSGSSLSTPRFGYSDTITLEDTFATREAVPAHMGRSLELPMRGTINGIWLTQKEGTLHPAIIPNVSSWVADAASCGFQVVLWTNKHELQAKEVEELIRQGVIVKDCGLCKESTLYPYFSFFLEKGIQGDKTAFALASDILRMAILEQAPATDYFIYVDPNDVTLVDLKRHLRGLPSHMSMNSLGFSFYVSPLLGRMDMFHVRNDVLIALKQTNPEFFRDYLNAYRAHLEKTYTEYFNPTTDGEAQTLARKITVQTSTAFFQIRVSSGEVFATFGPYKELWPIVHAEAALEHERNVGNGNTWLPLKDFREERMLMGELGKKHGLELTPKIERRSSSIADGDSDMLKCIARLEEKIRRLTGSLSGSGARFRDRDDSSLFFSQLGRLEDHFPDYPLAKKGDKKVAVQDPTIPSTYYLRLYDEVLLRVENYGSAEEKYETLYFDRTIRTREQCKKYETPLFKKAIQDLLEAQTNDYVEVQTKEFCEAVESRVAEFKRLNKDQCSISQLADNGLFKSRIQQPLQKAEALPLDHTPADPYGPGAIVLYKSA